MKNKIMVFGRKGLMSLCTVALAAVIGMGLAGCGDDDPAAATEIWLSGGNLTGTWKQGSTTLTFDSSSITGSNSSKLNGSGRGAYSMSTIIFNLATSGTVTGTYETASGSKLRFSGLTGVLSDWNGAVWIKQP
jgi:hypothetical protein